VRRAASGEPTFCFDEVREWSRERFERLVGLGLLREGPLAASVVCDACGKMHREDVLWEPSVQDPLGKRAYIRCEEGPVHVPEIRLRQWVFDGGVMARRLAAAMALSGTVEEISAGRVWKLGRRRLAGRFRDVFLSMAGTSEHARIADVAARHLIAKDGILLAGEERLNNNLDRLTVLDVAEVVELSAEGLTVDLDYIEDALPRDRAIKEDRIAVCPSRKGSLGRRSCWRSARRRFASSREANHGMLIWKARASPTQGGSRERWTSSFRSSDSSHCVAENCCSQKSSGARTTRMAFAGRSAIFESGLAV
jgi:hypothetical protein